MSEGERIVGGGPPVSTLIAGFLASSVGAKVIMALTGLGLWGFVIAHLVGNLQIFQGAEAINGYGVWLHELGHGAFVWVMRAGLLAIFVLHIFFGIRLAAKNRAARPIGYRKKKLLASNVAATSMAVTGMAILAFLLFHLAHTTWGLIEPEIFTSTTLKDGTHDIYAMMGRGFQLPWLVIVYLMGQIVLLAHLIHGTASLWQSLGFHHVVWTPAITIAGRAIAGVIVVLNISMPLYFYFRGFPS